MSSSRDIHLAVYLATARNPAMNTNEITGTLSSVLEDVTVTPPGPPHTYFGVAQRLLPAIRILAEPSVSAWAMALLSAHTLECLLKAYLSRDGSDDRLKHQQTRHNLDGLWRQAASEGLAVPADPPDWVVRLSELHNAPYYLRYSTGINGIVTPQPALMASELVALLHVVDATLLQA